MSTDIELESRCWWLVRETRGLAGGGVLPRCAWCWSVCDVASRDVPRPPLAPPTQGGNWCCAATQGWDAVPLEETFRWWGMCAMESVEMGSGASTSQLTLGRSPEGVGGGFVRGPGDGVGRMGTQRADTEVRAPATRGVGPGDGRFGGGCPETCPAPPLAPPLAGGELVRHSNPGLGRRSGNSCLGFHSWETGFDLPTASLRSV